MHTWIKYLVLMGLFQANAVFANACEDPKFLNNILKQTEINNPDASAIVACKVLPQHPDQLIMVYQQDLYQDDTDSVHSYALHLLTASQSSKKRLQYYRDPDSYTSDAMHLIRITLDTAAYQLNPQLRAIGLRLHYIGSSSVNPYEHSVLNLYDLSTKRKLLNKLRVNLNRGENDGHCNSISEFHHSSVQIRPTATHGMQDLYVTTKITKEETDVKKNDCEPRVVKQNKVNHLLKYNGKNYVIPKQLQE